MTIRLIFGFKFMLVNVGLFWIHLGYSHDEVVGRNCRFLQGPKTDHRAVQLTGECLRAEKPCTVKVLNYRQDTLLESFTYCACSEQCREGCILCGGAAGCYLYVQLTRRICRERA
ncbi:hypothetical protein GOP47_0004949 [Adiantum capillus-veneris]|uniref:Uncharacterized protein n=1 Tax=Adiantum capillus-veneris TaxID=13818 RepID=A0A9D4V489_ADICA|nr:hypothetical protein GOP47_0004949 [Adiantum capillus-veneris]